MKQTSIQSSKIKLSQTVLGGRGAAPPPHLTPAVVEGLLAGMSRLCVGLLLDSAFIYRKFTLMTSLDFL